MYSFNGYLSSLSVSCNLLLSPILRGKPDDPLAVEVVAVALGVEGGAHQAGGLQ